MAFVSRLAVRLSRFFAALFVAYLLLFLQAFTGFFLGLPMTRIS